MYDYTKLDKLLHHIVLGSPTLGEFLLDLEITLFSKKENKIMKRPVYITGLARAGTTVLMRSLYQSGEFASLTYDDMPFVLAPNIWHKFTKKNKKRRVKSERAHGDGIEIDFDSPEALEEVFWRTFHHDDYINSNKLTPHTFSSKTDKLLSLYQKLICNKYTKERYIAKNNNHILRIKSLAKSITKPFILIPYRDPIEQAHSLSKQHKNFKESDFFVQQYMTWLAHYEFGANHKPFQFNTASNINTDIQSINYWLARWVDAYGYIADFLKSNPDNIMTIRFERLCEDKEYWSKICKFIELEEDSEIEFIKPSSITENHSINGQLKDEAYKIYRELMKFG